jgi:hypothetical protein
MIRYYALEDMLTTDPSEKYGKTTLRAHYERIAKEGQECARRPRPRAERTLRCAAAASALTLYF